MKDEVKDFSFTKAWACLQVVVGVLSLVSVAYDSLISSTTVQDTQCRCYFFGIGLKYFFLETSWECVVLLLTVTDGLRWVCLTCWRCLLLSKNDFVKKLQKKRNCFWKKIKTFCLSVWVLSNQFSIHPFLCFFCNSLQLLSATIGLSHTLVGGLDTSFFFSGFSIYISDVWSNIFFFWVGTHHLFLLLFHHSSSNGLQ